MPLAETMGYERSQALAFACTVSTAAIATRRENVRARAEQGRDGLGIRPGRAASPLAVAETARRLAAGTAEGHRETGGLTVAQLQGDAFEGLIRFRQQDARLGQLQRAHNQSRRGILP